MVVFSKDVGVKVCDSRRMHVWSTNYVTKLACIVILIVYLCVKVGRVRWLTPTNLPPRGIRNSNLLRGLINFCNNYMDSL